MGSEVIIVPSLFLMIAYVFYAVANAITQRQQLKSAVEFQTKLLERMGTVAEFGQFVNTEGGQKLLVSGGGDGGNAAHHRVLRAFQSGTVMVCLGLGIFLYLSDVRVHQETYEVIGFVGTVSAAIGAGLLLSGWISMRLSRRMGLINGTMPPAPRDVARSA